MVSRPSPTGIVVSLMVQSETVPSYEAQGSGVQMDLLEPLQSSLLCNPQGELVTWLEALVRCRWSGLRRPSCSARFQRGSTEHSPGSPSPWALGQAWGGELGGRSTGAKALLCLTAEIMLTGEKEKTLVEGAAAGRDIEEAAASGGLEGMTPGRGGAGAAGKAVGDTTGRQHQSEQLGCCPGMRSMPCAGC